MTPTTPIKIKICGLSTPTQALAAATAGADFVGLVFAPSRRQVTLEQAATIVSALRADPTSQHIQVVGLFVNTAPAEINRVIEQCGLDYVQLSGDETLEQAININRPLFKAIRLIEPAEDVVVADREQAWLQLQPALSPAEPVSLDYAGRTITLAACPWLVDAHVTGAYGGTGRVANWERAARFAQQRPLLLAGGLTPENVGVAIQTVRPWGVDVSSGVEVAGQKDPARIQAFIAAARAVSRP